MLSQQRWSLGAAVRCCCCTRSCTRCCLRITLPPPQQQRTHAGFRRKRSPERPHCQHSMASKEPGGEGSCLGSTATEQHGQSRSRPRSNIITWPTINKPSPAPQQTSSRRLETLHLIDPTPFQPRTQDVALLDVRGRVDTAAAAPGVEKSTYLSGYDDYLEGHIPGAVFFNWTKDGVDLAQPVPAQVGSAG
jgi:hypothetical protein